MDRLDREKEFHNEAFATNKRKSVKKYYKTTDRSKSFYHDKIHEDVTGKTVLEYGCGPGSQAFSLAKAGATVTAIDISDVAFEQTKEEAERQGLEIECFVMDAGDLTFDDNSFDRVCGSVILHHLDRCYKELRRVLKPGGSGIFFEPMGYNPVINLYRKMTPDLRTDDEHPLLNEDFELAKTYFDEVTPHFFRLTSIAASFIPAASAQSALGGGRPLNGLDSVLFKSLPFPKKYAWIAVVELITSRNDHQA